MKRFVTLLLAAGLVFSASMPVKAADVSVSGEWDFTFEWADTGFSENDSTDTFGARQRLRTKVDIVASENLKGVVQFEMGDTTWGSGDGALGTDGKSVEVRHTYVDWMLPSTDLRIRMGLQGFALPGAVAGSPIFDDDVAGLTLSYAFTDDVAATLFWLRPFSNNQEQNAFGSDNSKDEMDLVGLSLPVTGSGWEVNPWAMVGFMGRDSVFNHYTDGDGNPKTDVESSGLLPAGAKMPAQDGDTTAYWAGISGLLSLADPLFVAFDAMYGNVEWGNALNNPDFSLDRAGWMFAMLAEYKLDMMTPGLVAWYASGDDSNPYDGSERLPSIAPAWGVSTFGFDGAYGLGSGAVCSATPAGTWGLIARLANMSFTEDMTHSLLVGYYEGTNDEQMVRQGFVSSVDSGDVYLTDKDNAWEVNFDTQYQVYENLTLAAEFGYLKLDLDSSVWGSLSDVRDDAYKAGVSFTYSF